LPVYFYVYITTQLPLTIDCSKLGTLKIEIELSKSFMRPLIENIKNRKLPIKMAEYRNFGQLTYPTTTTTAIVTASTDNNNNNTNTTPPPPPTTTTT
jgi:hypothetical protein